MIVKRIKLFAEGEENNGDKTKVAIGAGIAGAGAIGLKKMDKSEVTGRVKRYHATDKDLLDKIKEEGLKGSKANGDTYTKKVLDHLSDEELANKVYLGKKKSVSRSVALGRRMRGYGKQGMLNLNIDYDDWKNMKKVENPELLGAKNSKEYVKRLLKKKGQDYEALSKPEQIIMDAMGKQSFKGLGEKGTEVIEGDIASKYIKGGKGYEKNSLKKIAKYAKNNPKRFAKGAAKAGLAVGAIGTGAAIAAKGAKKEKK